MPWLLKMTSLVSLIMAPAVIYLLWRLYIASKQTFARTNRLVLLLPLVMCTFYLFPLSAITDFYVTGDIDLLKYPRPLTYWFWFGLVFVFNLATWVIIADVLKLFSSFFSWDRNFVSQWHSRAVVALFAIVFVFVATKTYRDTTLIITEHLTLPVENLPESLEGFKIAHITDIQGDEYTGQQQIAHYIEKVNAQNPDLIVFTGDLVSYGTNFIEMSAKEFGKAQSTYGIYAVVGDHDYWAGLEHIKPALADEEIPLLQDVNYSIEVDSSLSAVVTGITEVYSKSSNPQTVDSLMRNSDDVALKILASHQVKPHLVRSSQEHSYDIILAGHTHGGQIRVPFMGMDFAAAERETKYVRGLYWEDKLPIHVNNGLGFTLGPIRYNAPPTVTIIELVEDKSPS